MQNNQIESPVTPISPNHNATVVGAGPSGLAVVGTLLDGGLNSILWIDPIFNAGRLSNYPEVPSNTKLKYFNQYIDGSSAFKDVIKVYREKSSEHCSIFNEIDQIDPEKIVTLDYAIKIVKSLTEMVLEHYKDKITKKASKVTRIEGKDSDWTVHTEDGDKFKSDLVFLSTGSNPNEIEDCRAPEINSVVKLFANDAKYIDVDLSLYPSKLAETIKPEDTVAVIGSSHSAILALRNFVELPEGSRPKKIYNFYNAELKYAVYMDGWILYDGTGLKGDTARWAKENLSQDTTTSVEGLKRLNLNEVMKNEKIYSEELSSINKCVLCIGFKRNVLPELVIDKQVIQKGQISYDDGSANIVIKRDVKLSTMLGNGIAFPEKITDPHGNVEHVVGLWKFMKFARQTIPPVLEEYFKKTKN